MVFDYPLHNMAPFEILKVEFCMFVWRASFVFSCPGADLGDRGWIFGPGVNILARGPFWGQKCGPKKVVSRRNDFVVRIQGNPSCPNEFYGP